MTHHNHNRTQTQTPRRRGIFPPPSTSPSPSATLTASADTSPERRDPLDMILYCDDQSRRRQPQQAPYFDNDHPYCEDHDDDLRSQHSDLSESLRTTLSAPTIGNSRRPDPPLAYQSEGEHPYGYSSQHQQQQQQQQQLLHRRRPLSSTNNNHLANTININNSNNNNNNNNNNMPRLPPRTTNDPPSSSSYRSEADETTYYSDDSYFAARHISSAHRRRVLHPRDDNDPMGMDGNRSLGNDDDDSARMMIMMDQRPPPQCHYDHRGGRTGAAPPRPRMEPSNFREPYGHERNSPLGLELRVRSEEPADPHRRPSRRIGLSQRRGDDGRFDVDERYASDRSGSTHRRRHGPRSSSAANSSSFASPDVSRGVLFWAAKVDAVLQFFSDILSFFLGIFISKQYDGRRYGPSKCGASRGRDGRRENPYHDEDENDRRRRHHSPPLSIRSDKWIDIEVAERKRMAAKTSGNNPRTPLPRSSSMPVNSKSKNHSNNRPFINNNDMHDIPEEDDYDNGDDHDEYTVEDHRDRYQPSFEPPTVTLMDLHCDRPKNRRPPLGRIQRRVDHDHGTTAFPSDEQSEVLEDTISVLHMSGVSALIPPNNNNNNRAHPAHARHNANGPNGRPPQEEYVRRVSASSAGGGGGTAPFPRTRTLPTRFPQGKEFKQTTPFVTRHDSVLFLHQ